MLAIELDSEPMQSNSHLPSYVCKINCKMILPCTYKCLQKSTPVNCFSFIYLFIHLLMTLQPFVGPWPLLQFRNLFYTAGRTPWTGNQPVVRPLPTRRTTQAQNKRTQTSMSSVGFEPTIPAFERAKTVHALDRAATVIGPVNCLPTKTSYVILLLLCVPHLLPILFSLVHLNNKLGE
jgi:hypothetical protein